MQPQQPYTHPPQNIDHTPYDFIMNAGQPPKRPSVSGPTSMKQRILVVGLIFLGVIVLISVMAAVFSGGGGSRESLLRVRQLQAETIRISDLSMRNLSSQAAKNATINAKLSAGTDSQQLTAVLASRNIEFKTADVALGQDPEIENRLETAQAAGLIDETALQILIDTTTKYESALAEAFKETKNPEVKAELERAYASAQLLNKQLKKTTI
jgi:hypothetical protein